MSALQVRHDRTPDVIRTRDLLIRNQLLYPAELRGRIFPGYFPYPRMFVNITLPDGGMVNRKQA